MKGSYKENSKNKKHEQKQNPTNGPVSSCSSKQPARDISIRIVYGEKDYGVYKCI